nr:PREDICTED: uncharacterized protein KIAA1755-like [Apteryx mantelli mantelli]
MLPVSHDVTRIWRCRTGLALHASSNNPSAPFAQLGPQRAARELLLLGTAAHQLRRPPCAVPLPAGLVTASPPRTSLEAAEGLYNQLEEDVHDLVSKSNSCLERLEFLRKTRELEAEFGELGRWLDGEAAARLEEMGAQECSPDSFEKSFEQFKEFLAQATARYNHGLALCQEAAEVQDSAFPEADPFQAAAALFRAKLMSFHTAAERRRAELEMLRELCNFSSQITWLSLDCTGCGKRGESQPGNLEALQGLESSFQKLSVDFSLEKLQEMTAQVRAMRSSSGLGAWSAAWQRYRETRRILEEMLAELRQARGADAGGSGQGDVFGPSRSAAPGKEAPVCKDAPSPVPGSRRPDGARECGDAGPPLAGGSLPKPDSGVCMGMGGSVTRDLGRPVQGRPLALPARMRCTEQPGPSARAPPAEAAQYFQVSSQSSLSSDDSDSHASTEEPPAAALPSPRGTAPPCPSGKSPHILYLEKHLAEAGAE